MDRAQRRTPAGKRDVERLALVGPRRLTREDLRLERVQTLLYSKLQLVDTLTEIAPLFGRNLPNARHQRANDALLAAQPGKTESLVTGTVLHRLRFSIEAQPKLGEIGRCLHPGLGHGAVSSGVRLPPGGREPP